MGRHGIGGRRGRRGEIKSLDSARLDFGNGMEYPFSFQLFSRDINLYYRKTTLANPFSIYLHRALLDFVKKPRLVWWRNPFQKNITGIVLGYGFVLLVSLLYAFSPFFFIISDQGHVVIIYLSFLCFTRGGWFFFYCSVCCCVVDFFSFLFPFEQYPVVLALVRRRRRI